MFSSPMLIRLVHVHAGANTERATEVSGAWLVLAQIAALDPTAPSWEFLQVNCPSSLLLTPNIQHSLH